MSEVAILVPTLGRPERLEPLVENVGETTAAPYRIVFVLDADDAASWEVVKRLALVREDVAGLQRDGTYPEKINAGVAATTEPWVLLTADDVVFHPGWWEATAEARFTVRDKRRCGVIGTNDLHNPATAKGKYATQILVARWYIDAGLATADTQPGKAFHEGYHHEQIDRELCHVARARGLYAHAAESVIEHLHFATGQRPRDATDEKGNRAARQADKALYEARRHLWEG